MAPADPLAPDNPLAKPEAHTTTHTCAHTLSTENPLAKQEAHTSRHTCTHTHTYKHTYTQTRHFVDGQQTILWRSQRHIRPHMHAHIQPHMHADTHAYKHTYKHTYSQLRTYTNTRAKHTYTHKLEIFQCERKLILQIEDL